MLVPEHIPASTFLPPDRPCDVFAQKPMHSSPLESSVLNVKWMESSSSSSSSSWSVPSELKEHLNELRATLSNELTATLSMNEDAEKDRFSKLMTKLKVLEERTLYMAALEGNPRARRAVGLPVLRPKDDSSSSAMTQEEQAKLPDPWEDCEGGHIGLEVSCSKVMKTNFEKVMQLMMDRFPGERHKSPIDNPGAQHFEAYLQQHRLRNANKKFVRFTVGLMVVDGTVKAQNERYANMKAKVYMRGTGDNVKKDAIFKQTLSDIADLLMGE